MHTEHATSRKLPPKMTALKNDVQERTYGTHTNNNVTAQQSLRSELGWYLPRRSQVWMVRPLAVRPIFFWFCGDDVVHEMLSIGRISESRRRICHLNDAIQKYISLRVTLGLPSIFAWQARMRSLGFRLAHSFTALRVKKENYPD